MQPCRSLPSSWACRQCRQVYDRAVGERCTTKSGSIHKHHHWSADVHYIYSYANTEFRAFPPATFLKYHAILHVSCTISNPSRNIQSKIHLLEQHGHKTYYLPHAQKSKHVYTHRHKTWTIKHHHSHNSIQYQHTITTAFHVLFKIMRSSCLLLTEEEWLVLPLNRHMPRREELCDGRRKEW